MSLTIELPWPSSDLSPNSRAHWRYKALAVKQYRQAAYLATVNAMNRAGEKGGWPAATVQTTFYVLDRRRRDLDNLMAMLKPAWDGMVDAGLLTDDNELTPLAPQKKAAPSIVKKKGVILVVDREDKLPTTTPQVTP